MHICYFASLKDTYIETEFKKQTFTGKKEMRGINIFVE